MHQGQFVFAQVMRNLSLTTIDLDADTMLPRPQRLPLPRIIPWSRTAGETILQFTKSRYR
jgi:hypothetical protein